MTSMLTDLGNFFRMLVRPVVTVSLVAAVIYLSVVGNKEVTTALVGLAGVAVNAWFSDRKNGPAELGDN